MVGVAATVNFRIVFWTAIFIRLKEVCNNVLFVLMERENQIVKGFNWVTLHHMALMF